MIMVCAMKETKTLMFKDSDGSGGVRGGKGLPDVMIPELKPK